MQQNKNFLPGVLKVIKGADATIPHSADNRVILCLTDINGNLETDFAKRLVKRWAKVNSEFRSWYRGQINFKLGNILPIAVQTDTEVICLLALNDGVLDIGALNKALIAVSKYIILDKKNIHINKSDSYWDEIEKLLIENFIKLSINVSIYEN